MKTIANFFQFFIRTQKHILFLRFLVLLSFIGINFTVRFSCSSSPLGIFDALILTLQSVSAFQLFNHLLILIRFIKEKPYSAYMQIKKNSVYFCLTYLAFFVFIAFAIICGSISIPANAMYGFLIIYCVTLSTSFYKILFHYSILDNY